MTRPLTALAFSLAVIGCSSPEEASMDAPWVDVGHGLEAFAPLEDGDRVEMVFGTQGRWHIDLASHFGGTDADDHIAMYRVWDLSHAEQITYPARMFVTPGEVTAHADGTFEQAGIRGVFAIESADEVRDQEWLVEVELIVGKDVFVDERVVVVIDEEP